MSTIEYAKALLISLVKLVRHTGKMECSDPPDVDDLTIKPDDSEETKARRKWQAKKDTNFFAKMQQSSRDTSRNLLRTIKAIIEDVPDLVEREALCDEVISIVMTEYAAFLTSLEHWKTQQHYQLSAEKCSESIGVIKPTVPAYEQEPEQPRWIWWRSVLHPRVIALQEAQARQDPDEIDAAMQNLVDFLQNAADPKRLKLGRCDDVDDILKEEDYVVIVT